MTAQKGWDPHIFYDDYNAVTATVKYSLLDQLLNGIMLVVFRYRYEIGTVAGGSTLPSEL